MEANDIQPLLSTSHEYSPLPASESTEEGSPRLKGTSNVLLCFKSVTVEITAFLYLFSWSIQNTLVTTLLLNKTCIVHFNLTPDICLNQTSPEENEVQVYADSLLVWKSLLENIPSIFICLFMGHLSDSYGRKLPLILPLVGNVLASLILMINVYLYMIPPEYILIASIPKGLTGNFAVLIMAAYAYISDRTTVEERTKRIAYVDANFLLGPLCGSLLSVPIYATLGYMGAFGIGGVFFFVDIIYTYYRISETIPTRVNGSEDAPSGVLSVCTFCFRGTYDAIKTTLTRRKKYDRAIILSSTAGLSLTIFIFGSFDLKFLYVEKRFSWSYNQYIGLMVADCVCLAFGIMLILPALIRLFRLEAIGLNIIGCLSGMTAYLLIGFAPYSWFLYIASASSAFSFIPNVVLRSSVSKLVPSEELGKVFSVIACIEVTTPLLSVPAMTLLYNYTIHSFPGSIFVLCSALYVLLLIVTVPVQVLHKKESALVGLQEEEDPLDVQPLAS